LYQKVLFIFRILEMTDGFVMLHWSGLREAKALFRDRHRANAFARRRENRIRKRGQNRRQCRFA
jgi:hypothetical protein